MVRRFLFNGIPGTGKGSLAAFAHDAAERSYQLRSRRAQLVVMMKSEFAENLLPFRSECQKNFAPIIPRAGAMDIPSAFEPVHQFDGAVVANLHSVREFADARTNVRRHTLDGQHQLVLAAFQARLLYYLLAEVEKSADLVAELRQRLVVGQSQLLHSAIVSCRDPVLLYRNTI